MALPGVLLFAAFLVGVTGWMVGHLRTDMGSTRELEDAHAAGRVADAAVQAVALALTQVTDWTAVDALSLAMPCAPALVVLAPLDEGRERAWLQAETDAGGRWGADTPQWVPLWACHGAGVLGTWLATGLVPSVVVWVADDPEGDGQPFRSGNQRLLLTAVARAGGQARGAASVTISRAGPGSAVTLLAWRGAPGV